MCMFTYIAIHFAQQALPRFCALCVVPADVQTLERLHLLLHVAVLWLCQHCARVFVPFLSTVVRRKTSAIVRSLGSGTVREVVAGVRPSRVR